MKTAAFLPLIAVLAVNGSNLRRLTPSDPQIPNDDSLITPSVELHFPTSAIPKKPIIDVYYPPDYEPVLPKIPDDDSLIAPPVERFFPISAIPKKPIIDVYYPLEPVVPQPIIDTTLPADYYDGPKPTPHPLFTKEEVADLELLVENGEIPDDDSLIAPPVELHFPTSAIPKKPIIDVYYPLELVLPQPIIDTTLPADYYDGPKPAPRPLFTEGEIADLELLVENGEEHRPRPIVCYFPPPEDAEAVIGSDPLEEQEIMIDPIDPVPEPVIDPILVEEQEIYQPVDFINGEEFPYYIDDPIYLPGELPYPDPFKGPLLGPIFEPFFDKTILRIA